MDRFKKWHARIVATTAVVSVQAIPALAVEPEDILAPTVGPVVILPHASLAGTYNDNVFYSTD